MEVLRVYGSLTVGSLTKQHFCCKKYITGFIWDQEIMKKKSSPSMCVCPNPEIFFWILVFIGSCTMNCIYFIILSQSSLPSVQFSGDSVFRNSWLGFTLAVYRKGYNGLYKSKHHKNHVMTFARRYWQFPKWNFKFTKYKFSYSYYTYAICFSR